MLQCYIGKNKLRKISILTKQNFKLNDNLVDDLAFFLRKTITSVKSKITCRIILLDNLLNKAYLPIPNISLMPYEIDNYVKHHLVSLFASEDTLAYDFLVEDNPPTNETTKQLAVYAYQIKELQPMTNLLTWQIDFIGLPEILINQVNEQQIDINGIAEMTAITGINLLPWRDKQRRNKRRNLIIFISGMAIILIIVTTTIITFSTQKLNQQIIANENLENYHSQVKSKLMQLNELTHKNNQLKTLQDQQQEVKQNYQTIIRILESLSINVSNKIWLNNLQYQNNEMNINGSSFLYDDILLFVDHMNQLESVLSCKIISIKKQDEQLQFNLVIQLKHADRLDD